MKCCEYRAQPLLLHDAHVILHGIIGTRVQPFSMNPSDRTRDALDWAIHISFRAHETRYLVDPKRVSRIWSRWQTSNLHEETWTCGCWGLALCCRVCYWEHIRLPDFIYCPLNIKGFALVSAFIVGLSGSCWFLMLDADLIYCFKRQGQLINLSIWWNSLAIQWTELSENLWRVMLLQDGQVFVHSVSRRKGSVDAIRPTRSGHALTARRIHHLRNLERSCVLQLLHRHGCECAIPWMQMFKVNGIDTAQCASSFPRCNIRIYGQGIVSVRITTVAARVSSKRCVSRSFVAVALVCVTFSQQRFIKEPTPKYHKQRVSCATFVQGINCAKTVCQASSCYVRNTTITFVHPAQFTVSNCFWLSASLSLGVTDAIMLDNHSW